MNVNLIVNRDFICPKCGGWMKRQHESPCEVIVSCGNYQCNWFQVDFKVTLPLQAVEVRYERDEAIVGE